jgi:hypothetical protein
VKLLYFTVSHADTAAADGLVPPKGSQAVRSTELASHLHFTQAHDLVLRVREQLMRVNGEQRYFRARYAPPLAALWCQERGLQ